MISRHVIGTWANLFLLLFLVEASAWRLFNLGNYAKLVSHVTVGASRFVSASAVVALSSVEVSASVAFLCQKDGRRAAAALVVAQLAKYGLLREISGPLVVAILLACLRLTENLERSTQTMSSSFWVKIDEFFRKTASKYSVAPFLIVGVAFEIVGVLLRFGERGYAATLAHDRASFSLSVCSMCLHLATFDERPSKHVELANEWFARNTEDISPRFEVLCQRSRERAGALRGKLARLWPRPRAEKTLELRAGNKRL